MQIITPKGEFAYVNVFRPAPPQDGTDGEDKYQLTVTWDEDEDLSKLEKAIESVAIEKFGKKAIAMLERGQLKSPLRHGAEREADWLQDRRFLTARSIDRPDIVDADCEDIIDPKEVYPGAIGRMDIWLQAYDRAGNKGVSAFLNNVQKLEDGERKGGRRGAAAAFGGEEDRPSKGTRGRVRSAKEEPEDEDESPRRSRTERAGARRARRRV